MSQCVTMTGVEDEKGYLETGFSSVTERPRVAILDQEHLAIRETLWRRKRHQAENSGFCLEYQFKRQKKEKNSSGKELSRGQAVFLRERGRTVARHNMLHQSKLLFV